MDNDDIFSMIESHGSWGMSDFQSRYFVVNSQVTNYRRVRQAILEIETRIAAKKQIERNVKKTEIEKKICERNLLTEEDDLQKELIEVDIDQLNYDLSVYEKKYRVVLDELNTFAEIIKDIVPDLETMGKYKANNEIEERNYWIARLGKQAAMDLLTIGRVGQGNMDSIAMMPIDDQKATIKAAIKYNKTLSEGIEYLEQESIKELSLNKVGINYIDEIISDQLKIEKNSGEDI